MNISQEELVKLMEENEITVADCIDAAIQRNGIIGVGLISLGDTLKDYCYKHDGYQN